MSKFSKLFNEMLNGVKVYDRNGEEVSDVLIGLNKEELEEYVLKLEKIVKGNNIQAEKIEY